jgi:excisionase family DNA binding protein
MSHRPSPIDSAVLRTPAAVVGGRAAVFLLKLVGPGWRQRLAATRVLGDDLEAVEAAMAALEDVAAAWRGELLAEFASPAGSPSADGEGHRSSWAPTSGAWISTSETAQLLGVSPRRVRQFVEARTLSAVMEGGRLYFELPQVLALRRVRDAG